MNEKEIKQLLKLLDKFRTLKAKTATMAEAGVIPEDEFNGRERGILSAVRQWIVWYGDEQGFEI